MSSDTVAKVYAQALFEACSSAGNVTEAWQELGFLADVWKDQKSFRLFVDNPSIDKCDKQELINKVFKDLEQELVKSFLGVLVKKGRIGHMPEIVKAFENLVNEQSGVQLASLESAVALEVGSKDELITKLSKRFDKKIVLQETINPALLGGFIVRVGDTVIDGSVKRNVLELAHALGGTRSIENVWENS